MLAAFTGEGFDAVRQAAPARLRAARELVLDRLGRADPQAVADISRRLRIVPAGLTGLCAASSSVDASTVWG
ncbi:hypothetical protein [Streptomyces sp. NPDC101181]|uniref:hypothetical protein n=1 Tax=Streptomyces sp. NPDC101181 TaxID=3366125 RepID=UPI00382ADE96